MKIFVRHQEGETPRKKSHGCLVTVIIMVVLYVGACGWMGYTLSRGSSVSLEKNTVYVLNMRGIVQEQAAEDNPLAALMQDMPGMNQPTETQGLDEILSNIALAKEDDRIQGILLQGGGLGVGPASAEAIRKALIDYKESGKWLIAYAPSYNNVMSYYIASVADTIYLNPTGSVAWNGLGGTKMYYTRLLEKIGVEMQVLKVGTFKSAVEPYFRTSMSEADRMQTLRYLNGIWDEVEAGVSASRGIDRATLSAYADEMMSLQPAEKAVAYRLVDTLVYQQTVDSVLKYRCGGKMPHRMTTSKLASIERKQNKSKNMIAVVYAEGEITDASGDGIVGTKMVKTLSKVAKDKDVKAVVLRVNSPGGSADASEQIWHAEQVLKEKGLPMVVSMGDYAASGGYYISCSADYIYAEPTTLTGSIGIFGLIPSMQKLREKVGLDIDEVGTHRHATMMSGVGMRSMTEDEQQMMQAMIERGYDLFTGRCAAGRGLSQDSIKVIGEGRVWLGKDALQIGLVDSLGGIDDAIRKAAELAGVGEDYELGYWPEKKDFLTTLLESLDNTTEEERLVIRLRQLCEKPRLMMRTDEIQIL